MMPAEPLVENTVKQVVSFTRNNKMTAADLKETAKKLLALWEFFSNID